MPIRPFPEPRNRGRFQPFQPAELNRLYGAVQSHSAISASPGLGAGMHVDSTGPHLYTNGTMDGGFWATIVDNVGGSPSQPVYTWTSVIDGSGGGSFDTPSLETPDGQQLSSPTLPYLPAYEINNQTVAPGTVVRMFWGWGPWLYFAAPMEGTGSGTTIQNFYVDNFFVNNLTFIETSITISTSVYVLNSTSNSKFLLTPKAGGSTINSITGGTAGQLVAIENVGADPLILGVSGNILTPLGIAYYLWPRDGVILQSDGTNWRFDVPTFGCENTDATQIEYAVRLLLAHNDQGTNAFGRLYGTSNGDGSYQLDWQGQRGTANGVAFVGPQPDTWIGSSDNSIQVAVTSDAAKKVIHYDLTGAGDLVTENTDLTQVASPTTTIKANNDLGTAALGRIRFTTTGGGPSTQLDWQGFRGTVNNSVFVGPGKDLYLSSTNGSIAIVPSTAGTSVRFDLAAALTRGQYILGGPYTVTTSYAFVNDGTADMSVTLPQQGGIYQLTCQISCQITSNAMPTPVEAKLFDVTAGADVAGSRVYVLQQLTGQLNEGGMTICMQYGPTANANTVIKCKAVGPFGGAGIIQGFSGHDTVLSFVQLL